MPYKILELYDQENTPEPEPYSVQNEGILGNIGRNISRTGSRAIETAIGTPRSSYDILQMIGGYIPEPVKKAAKTAATSLNPALGLVEPLLSAVGPMLPSSQDVRETIGKTTQPGYLEPQGPGEEVGDAITQAMTSILLGKAKIPGISGATKGSFNTFSDALKSIGTSTSPKEAFNALTEVLKTSGKEFAKDASKEIAQKTISGLKTIGKTGAAVSSGQAAKFLSKKLGASELGQEATNLGTTLLVGAGLDADFKKTKDLMYKIRDEAIKPGENVKAQPLLGITSKARNEFLDIGVKDLEGKSGLKSIVDAVEDIVIGDNVIPLNDLVNIKKQVSEAWYKLPKGEAKNWANEIRKKLKETLNDPKLTGNKVFSQAQKAGDELNTHLKSSEKITEWAKNTLSSSNLVKGGAAGFALGLTKDPISTLKYSALAVPAVGGAIGGAAGIGKTGLLVKNILTKPAIAKEYARMMGAASKQNVGQFIKSAEKFNKAVEKSGEPSYEILELY